MRVARGARCACVRGLVVHGVALHRVNVRDGAMRRGMALAMLRARASPWLCPRVAVRVCEHMWLRARTHCGAL